MPSNTFVGKGTLRQSLSAVHSFSPTRLRLPHSISAQGTFGIGSMMCRGGWLNKPGLSAMFEAIWRASSHVSTFGCRASFSSRRKVGIGDRLPVGVFNHKGLLKFADGQGAGKRRLLPVPHACRRTSLPPVGVNPVNRRQRRKIPQRHFQNIEWPITTLSGHLMRQPLAPPGDRRRVRLADRPMRRQYPTVLAVESDQRHAIHRTFPSRILGGPGRGKPDVKSKEQPDDAWHHPFRPHILTIGGPGGEGMAAANRSGLSRLN
jgi:hypothetical protein